MAMQVARNLQRESIWHLKVNVLTSKWTMWKVEVDIGKRIGKSRKLSGKVKILPMMAHNLWPAVQERLQRSMDSMIFKAQFIVVSHHGVFDMFYHFWLRWTHWSSPFWYFKHGGMMWDVFQWLFISGIYCQLGDYIYHLPPIRGTRNSYCIECLYQNNSVGESWYSWFILWLILLMTKLILMKSRVLFSSPLFQHS